jgi:hypothetical protein
MVNRTQHFCASENCARASQEYQFNLRSLDDRLRERKETAAERNHLQVGPSGLAIWKAKDRRIQAL